jgi:tRNA nucleotidyltransferase (CCA-adding enzyme)
MQFAGRFDMSAAPSLVERSRKLRNRFHTIARDPMFEEWYKWAAKSVRPSRGIEFLRETTWIEAWPELSALQGVQQDPQWHPEGDAFAHTLHVVDAAARIAERDALSAEDRAVVVFAALAHDMGKATTTVYDRGRWRSPDHHNAGVPRARAFMQSIGAPKRFVNRVCELTREHMFHVFFETATARIARRLIARLQYVDVATVLRVVEADHSGRPPLAGGLPERARIVGEHAAQIDNAIPALVRGRDLIDRGFEPGPQIGRILRETYERQIDSDFADFDEAIAYALSTA